MHAPISSPINKSCSRVALVRCWSVITLGVGPRDQTDVLTLVEERERSDITNLWIYHNPIDTNSIVYDRLPLIRSDYVHFLAISKPIRFSPNIIDEELFGTVNKLFPCQQVHFYIHINRKGLMCTIWVKSYFFLYMYLSTFVEHYIKTTLPLQTLILLNSISSHFYFVKNQQHQNQTVN